MKHARNIPFDRINLEFIVTFLKHLNENAVTTVPSIDHVSFFPPQRSL